MTRSRTICTALLPVYLAAWVAMAGSASAAVQYLDDGAKQNAEGGWDMPNIGSCSPNAALPTRAECEALRLAATSQSNCTSLGGSWSTGSVCNDLTKTNQADCLAAGNRMWNAGTNICAVTMKGYNRNRAVCLNLGGTWAAAPAPATGTCRGSWVFPAATAFTPPLYTGTGPGDQCLRCHNSQTEWNTNRVRDVEGTLMHGHKNMSRKVTAGVPWAGPDGEVYVSDDAGNAFDWVNGTIAGNQAFWIYGDWLGPLPRVISATSTSYTCGRCHTTGWVNSADATREPELSFPGIRTGRTITGSWDLFGITCSRCHGSSVEDAAGGSCSVANLFTQASCTAGGGTWTAGAYPAAYARGATHHADVTNFDAVNGGYCTNMTLRNANKLICEHMSGEWFSACTDDRWYSATQCVSAKGCINPATGHAINQTSEANCESATSGECTIPVFTTSASCTAGGGTWTAAATDWWADKTPGKWTSSSCSIGGGTCSVAGNTTPETCEDAFGVWTPSWGDLFQCMDAGGHWTGNKERRGQLITSVCMDCHRQETGGNPYDTSDPAGVLKVGPAHGSVEFVSHPHANQFLNSPHGKFSGKFSEIGTATFGDGYDSYFQHYGEASNTGNGCTGCHNVHESIVEDVGSHHAIHEDCTDCHTKDLNKILHPLGGGTPMEEMDTHPAEACISCHMPHGEHLWRINVDPTYSTFPATALTATVNANADPDGDYDKAVWVDVDGACGKCHGGGSGQAFAIGSITAGTKKVMVDDAGDFATGQRITIAGAGALEKDGITRGDFDSYVVSVSGNEITLAGNASATVSGSTVEANATKNGAAYMTKVDLAGYAKKIHNDEPLVRFSYTLGSPNTLQVNLDASRSKCSEQCDAYEWDFGDGNTGWGVTTSHTYAAAGQYRIRLTVHEYSVNEATKGKRVTVYAPDSPPNAVGTCNFDANTWTETVTDSSTDDKAIAKVIVQWGDGTVLSEDSAAPFGPFTHTFLNAGTYTITHKVVDSIGQVSSKTCSATPAVFTISGSVFRSNGTTPVPAAKIEVRKGASLVRTVYTSSSGAYTVGNLKPGTYTLTVTKSGFTFASPAATVVVGPSQTVNVNATAP